MKHSEERDVVGEVIAEDAAERAAKLAIGTILRVGEDAQFQQLRDFHVKDGMQVMAVTDHLQMINELRQQLADVSHERDLLKAANAGLEQKIAYFREAYETPGRKDLASCWTPDVEVK